VQYLSRLCRVLRAHFDALLSTQNSRLRSDAALTALLLVALLARIVGLDSIEPNVLPDEADHLTVLYRVLAGHGPGPFDLSWDGNPAASLYPALPFMVMLGPSYISLRLSSVLASLLALIVFFLLARRGLSSFAAFGATALLAFSGWYLFFSRNGEVNVWTLLYALSAAYFTQLALDSGQLRHWAAGGLFCGLGWYSYLGGVSILPMMLLYLALATLLDRRRWKRALWGGAVLTLLTTALLLPRLPILIEKWEAVELYVSSRSVLKDTEPADAARILARQVSVSLRTFVLLDPSLQGNSRYIAPGAPVLDSLTGTLYFAGLFLSLRRLHQTAMWWCLFAPMILVIQSLTLGIPDGARALPALPAMILFAGLAIDWLVQQRYLGDLARLGFALAIPLTAYWNWTHYVDWQRQPSNAEARQPAVEVAEFATWQELQMDRARSKQSGFTVNEWHNLRDRYRPTPSPLASPLARVPAAREIEVRPLTGFATVEAFREPRGVAVDAAGTAFLLEADGRILKFDRGGRTIATLGAGTGGPATEEVSDLALGPDGSLLALDAGRARIDRYDRDGRFVETLGARWGMYRPRGLAIGPTGLIYVADTGHNRVVVSNGDSVERALPGLEQPTDVAVDGRGWVYAVQPELG
jgi:4-amino-4-deoxy-L-arabinose transferase-like glycosyltransferase